MKLNEEQIERAKTVNLPSFLMANGFVLKKVGREYVWKEHDSLHIKDNGPGERGQWFRFSENKGGDNIAFLREYMGMSFVDAVEALTGEHIDRSYTASHTYTPHHIQQTARELSLAEADNARRVFAYLCKTRGLDYDMVSALVRSGVISQEEKTGNVLFKYFDEHGKVTGAEKVGTSTEHKFKGIATGSAGGHGFEVCRGDGSNLLFFESSIDMLSYLQMFSPDNCRLVSMMGVKPNIVLDTMERYGIAPQNVYLCSDNDEAGNDFANRLIAEYPDMKRIATPDTYKDWNDMLRDIPQKNEIKKEADSVAIQTYGNKTWNDATDNRDKSLVTFSVQDFLKLQEKLEQAGINYFGYVRENSVIMAVGDKDMEWFKQIAGTPDLMPTKSNRPYSPPEKNIFGTAEYRYIPQKEYLTADRDLVLKMAEIMAKRGMQFSGRVYPSGKGTLTVSHADIVTVGDKFRDRRTGEISEILSFSGALPWYEDQCTVQRESHGFIITENMSVDKLFDDKLYEYLGKGEVPEKSEVSEKTDEQVAPEQKAPVTADAKQAAELPKPKNLSQLKKALQVGMEFEILDHHKSERIGERRVVTGKNTANFTSKRLDENNQPYGDDIYMDWDRAANWRFNDDKITVMMAGLPDTVLLSFRFIDSKEHEKSEPSKTAEISVPETKEPVPVYTGEWKVSENTELYKQILAENLRFKEMALEVIGNGKNPADSVKALVGEFGMERTALLTALNIVAHPMDGRFYPADKEWACKVLAPYLDVKPDESIHRDSEKEHLFTLMIGGGQLFSIHNTHLAQFAETLIPEYEKYLELSHTAEKSEPVLSVGDFIEYKGKEYKVESLDPDGFITLNAPMLDGKVQDRVTFITEEFLDNAEYKLLAPKAENIPEKGDNFTITDDSLGSGGAKEKFRNNIAAIKMLKMLEKEHLPAYPEAKEVLSKYVGWGGLASAFDKNASSWAAEYAELKELLTPQEYRQAQASTLDAFYTSPTIINSIYEALDNFGFKSGNVLEPSMGIGNFFGCMSERMRVDSNLYGVELDSISGRIAQMLYPYADISIKGFEHNTFQNGCFDVAVGNVPFGDLGFTDTKHFTSKLHDYFFMEALDKVKNGGIIAFVTSSGTLDKKDESVRQMLADKADLIGAIRLPGGKTQVCHHNQVSKRIQHKKIG